MDIGALRQIRHSLWFVPNAPAADLRLTTYLMGVRGRRIRLTHVGTTTAAYTSTPIRIRTGGGPTEVDVSSFVAGHRWHQRFVLGPASARGRPSAGLQVATTCDGVSAQILTPIFGAGRQIPLRVGVSGRGRIVVSLIGPSGASLTRRIVVMRRRTQTIAFAPPRLSHGAYTVTVSAWRSRLPQPIRLTALLL